jgi:eukaryotic-like serine/threonine-protein kinase
MVCPVCASEYPADTRFCPVDGATLRRIADGTGLVGRVLDQRYFLVRKVGEGGMGEVFLGEHVRTKRRCAVKVVKRRHANDPEARERFLREATNAGRISHAHVATVYDFGETREGLPYLAMEYVDGEPLSVLVQREGLLSPGRTVSIGSQIAAAVDAAHDLGIVHRDLKPSNVLITTNKRGGDLVKVVDFGIARATSEAQQNLTRTGFIVGTPEFMSPEQMTGDPVDGRSDIYSLGCILYQMVTGEQAFGGPTAEVLKRRLTQRPPHPRDKNETIPRKLDQVIVTALARTPEERYQTMEELQAALVAAVAEPTTGSRPRWTTWLGQKLRAPSPPFGEAAGAGLDAPSTTGGSAPAVPPESAALPVQPAAAAFDSGGGAEVFERATLGKAGPVAATITGPSRAMPPAMPSAHGPATAGGAAGSAPVTPPRKPMLAGAAALWQRMKDGWQRDATDTAVEPAQRIWHWLPRREHAAGAEPDSAPPTGWRRFQALWQPASAVTVDGEPVPFWRRVPRAVVGAAVALVLVLVIVTFAIDGEPQVAATTVPLRVPPPIERRVPDDAALESIRGDLGLAKIESDGLRFDPALSMLRSTQTQVSALAAEFPGSDMVRLLSDSVGARLAETLRQCIYARDSLPLGLDQRCEGND